MRKKQQNKVLSAGDWSDHHYSVNQARKPVLESRRKGSCDALKMAEEVQWIDEQKIDRVKDVHIRQAGLFIHFNLYNYLLYLCRYQIS